MALNETILGEQIYKALTSGDPSQTKELCTQLARALITHFQQNALVKVTVETPSGAGTGTGIIL
jgi:hypothetical protein